MHSSFVRGEGTSGPEGRGAQPRAARGAPRQAARRRRERRGPEPPGCPLRHPRAARSGRPRRHRQLHGGLGAVRRCGAGARRRGPLGDPGRRDGQPDRRSSTSPTPDDFVTAGRLVKRYGHRKIALVQTTVDRLLGTGPEHAGRDQRGHDPRAAGPDRRGGQGCRVERREGDRGRRPLLPDGLLAGLDRCRPEPTRALPHDARGRRPHLGLRRHPGLARADRDHRVEPVGAVRLRAQGARASPPIGSSPSTRSKRPSRSIGRGSSVVSASWWRGRSGGWSR